MLHVAVTSTAMHGDQFRCVVTNPAGSTTSASATLTVNRAFFSGGQEVAVSYLTPQQTAGPASVSFSMIFSGRTYAAANGETASDLIVSYAVTRPGGERQVYPLNYTHRVPGTEDVYQASYSEYATLPAGVHSYGVSVSASHPEPYDRWVEAHWEDEHDNPNDPEEVTGQHWVDAHREIGFDWVDVDIGAVTVPFYIGVTPPAPIGPPTFQAQPASKAVVAGAPGAVTFIASAVAETIADLKWQRRTVASGAWVDLAPGGSYAIATGNNRTTLTIAAASAAMNGDQFRCIASNAAGSATSDSAVLMVHTVPVFTTQPINRNAVANTNVSLAFTATATGNPAPAYRWQRLDGNNWVDIGNHPLFSGTETATLTFNGRADTAHTFRCLATNVQGTATSQTARMELIYPPTFTAHPLNCTVTAGYVANFSVSVTGTSPMSYLWKRRNLDATWTNLSNDSNCTGATSANLAIWNTTVAMSGCLFQCIVTNSGGTSTSYFGYLTVQGPLGFSAHPQSRTVVPGSSVTFTVAANGNPGPSWYEWERFVDGQWRYVGSSGGAGNYSGAFTNTLTVSNTTLAMSGYQYRCLVSNSETTISSNAATLTVSSDAPTTPLITSALSASGTVGTAFSYAIIASNSPTSYQASGLPSGLTINSSIGVIGGTPIQSGTYNVSLNATNSAGTGTASLALTIHSSGGGGGGPVITRQPVGETIPPGWYAVFDVIASSGSAVTYQWRKGGVVLPGRTLAALALVSVTAADAGSYDVVVTNSAGATTSTAAALVVDEQAQVIQFFPLPNVAPASFPHSFSVSAATTSGLPVEFARAAGPASVSGQTVTVTGPGEVRIRASQPGGVNNGRTYHAALPVERSLAAALRAPAPPPRGTPLTAAAAGHQSIWDDFNGDGILDEFIPANVDGRFEVEIIPRDNDVFFTFVDYDWTSAPYFRDGRTVAQGMVLVPYFHTIAVSLQPLFADLRYRWTVETNQKYWVLREFDHQYGDDVTKWPRSPLPDEWAWNKGVIAGPLTVDDPFHAIGTIAGTAHYLLRRGQPFAATRINLGGTPVDIGMSRTGSPATVDSVKIGATEVRNGATSSTITLPNGQTATVVVDSTGWRLKFPDGSELHTDIHGKLHINLPPEPPQKPMIDVVDETGVPRGVSSGASILLGGGVIAGAKMPGNGSIYDGPTTNGQFEMQVQLGNNRAFPIAVTTARPMLAVDANRDGVINFNTTDATSPSAAYRFWLNDDDDRRTSSGTDSGGYHENSKDEVELPAGPNHASSRPAAARDLEDFTRMRIRTAGITSALKNGDLYLGLKWANVTGAPAIKIMKHTEADGGTAYLGNMATAGLQMQEAKISDARDEGLNWDDHRRTIQGSEVFILPTALFSQISESSPITYLLFEGAGVGKGLLKAVILKKEGQNYTSIGEGDGVWLDLKNIKSMYERAVATTGGPRSGNGVDYTIPVPSDYTGPDANNIPHPTMGWEPNEMGFAYQPDPQETQTYIVYVHGWRWSPQKAINRTETVFKRLWHAGYRGRLAALRWPTFYGGPDDGDSSPFPFPPGIFTFNNSEYRAWKSGESLKQFVNQLPSGYSRNVVAHSMGNFVAGEALRNGMAVLNYVMLNAAVPALSYDDNPTLRQWTYTTPNTDTDAGTKAMAYAGRFGTLNTNVVNFYLINDSATLNAWNINNTSWKPQWYQPENNGYEYRPTWAPGNRLSITFAFSATRFLVDAHEAMAYACQSLTYTVGAEHRTNGSIDDKVNMDALFQFGTEHGAEWDRSIQEAGIRDFYRRLLEELRITVP